jgi:radical SAM protein with 4Fe4S-binding SPASM domain
MSQYLRWLIFFFVVKVLDKACHSLTKGTLTRDSTFAMENLKEMMEQEEKYLKWVCRHNLMLCLGMVHKKQISYHRDTISLNISGHKGTIVAQKGICNAWETMEKTNIDNITIDSTRLDRKRIIKIIEFFRERFLVKKKIKLNIIGPAKKSVVAKISSDGHIQRMVILDQNHCCCCENKRKGAKMFESEILKNICLNHSKGKRTVYHCLAGVTKFCIDMNGDIFPCRKFLSLKKYKLGNVYKNIWHEEAWMMFSHSAVDKKTSCRTCWAKYLCGGGCTFNAYVKNGSIYKTFRGDCRSLKKFCHQMLMDRG